VIDSGVAWYVGIPEAGKTTLAAHHLADHCRANRRPCIVLDSQGVRNFASWRYAPSLEQLVELVWTQGQHVAITPRDEDDVEALCRVLLDAGHVNVLVDEAAYWMNAHTWRKGLLGRVMRAHRHCQVRLLLTTQHLSGDVPQGALSCAPDLYIFRCTAGAVLDRLETDFGVDRRAVAALAQGRFLHVRQGF